jgi:hypothetical protein
MDTELESEPPRVPVVAVGGRLAALADAASAQATAATHRRAWARLITR